MIIAARLDILQRLFKLDLGIQGGRLFELQHVFKVDVTNQLKVLVFKNRLAPSYILSLFVELFVAVPNQY